MTDRRSALGSILRGLARPALRGFQRTVQLRAGMCLISGAPRSGTTAISDWLSHQPGVAAFQESRILVGAHRFLQDVRRFESLNKDRDALVEMTRGLVLEYYSHHRRLIGKQVLIDKEPLEPVAFPGKEYGEFLAHVRALFPACRFLLAIRDPVATLWSMSERTWGESLTGRPTLQFTLEEYAQNWCACADLALQYCADPSVYVVQFGRLMHEPAAESKRILDFLELRHGRPFEARPTKRVGFDGDQHAAILRVVRPTVERLQTRGFSALM